MYRYDSWGKLLQVCDAAGEEITDQNHIAHINPLRYRGYYYDRETGLYYLLSRFYDPVTGRFVNADGYLDTAQGYASQNMFAYCGNNPVNLVDPSGQFAISAILGGIALWKVGAAILGIAAAAVIVSQPEVQDSVGSFVQFIADTIALTGDLIKQSTDEKEKEKIIAQPPSKNQASTYYHVTSYDKAMSIMLTGKMTGSPAEGGRIFAWKSKPTRFAIANSGARFGGVIISFKTYASFVPDEGIEDPKAKLFGPVVTVIPRPITVWDVQIVG